MTTDEALELFKVAPEVTYRKMFGGFGLYSEGRIFAIMDEGVIYLKGDDTVIPGYEEAGAEPFTYLTQNGPATMKYYRFPSDSVTLEHLDTALEVAHRAPMPKRAKKL